MCSPCWAEKGGDGTHVVNEGDRGWTRERAVRVGVSEGEERIVARRRGKKMRGRDSRADEMVMEEGGEGSEMGSGERGVRRSMRQRGRGESKDLVSVALAPHRRTRADTDKP